MAPRTPVNENAARNVVSESLGLSMDELGAGDTSDRFLNDDDGPDDVDEGDQGDDIQVGRRGQREQQEDDGDDGLDNEDLQFEPDQRRQQQQPDQRRQQQRQQDQNRPDDLSVSHTKKDEFDVKNIVFDKKTGNIINKDTNKVVATAGREARMFTTLHKIRGEYGSLQQSARGMIDNYRNKLNRAVEIGTSVANELEQAKRSLASVRGNLSEQEFQGAMELASMYQRDKVGAIKLMLTRAAASGIDLTTLGLQPGGFDVASLMNLMRSEIQRGTEPLKQFQDQRQTEAQRLQEQQQQEQAATEQLETFLFENPEARRFLPAIRKVYEDPRFQHMSLGEVWTRIQLNQMRRGQQGDPGSRRQMRSQNRNQRQLPDGRQRLGGSDGRQVEDNSMADVNESYDSIVRDVMKSL